MTDIKEAMRESQNCWCGMTKEQKSVIHSIYFHWFRNKYKNIRDIDFFTGLWLNGKLGKVFAEYAGMKIEVDTQIQADLFMIYAQLKVVNPPFKYYTCMERLGHLPLKFYIYSPSWLLLNYEKVYTDKLGGCMTSISTDLMTEYGTYTIFVYFQDMMGLSIYTIEPPPPPPPPSK